jgi:hypothetical protein
MERFKIYSSVHRTAVLSQSALKKGVNVAASLSKHKLQKLKYARQALLKIVSSIPFDKTTNIMQSLLLLAEDIPELKCWLQRNKYKWA